ncbi:MAG: hypothetical protein ACR2JY_04505 [Chloroflexota bacterium]
MAPATRATLEEVAAELGAAEALLLVAARVLVVAADTAVAAGAADEAAVVGACAVAPVPLQAASRATERAVVPGPSNW